MRDKKVSLITIFFIGAFVIGFSVVVLFNLYWSSSVKHSYSNYSSIIRMDYLNGKKEQVKSDVLKTVKFINYKRMAAEHKINNLVKYNLNEMLSLANKVYLKMVGRYSKEDVQSLLKQIFEESRNHFNYGAYLLLNKQGDVVGNFKFHLSNYSKIRFSSLFNKAKEGFFRGKMNDKEPFCGYVKYFKPLDCYALAYIFRDKFDKEMKKMIIFSIVSQNGVVDKNRYIFVNTKDGYAIITNNKVVNNGKKIWDVYSDRDSKDKIIKIFKEELRAYNSIGGRFIHYKWIEPETGIITDKISFVYGYKPWGWIIGEGFYSDETASIIRHIRYQFYGVINKILTKSYIFFFLIVVILFIFVYAIYIISKNYIKRIFERFEDYFKHRRRINRKKCKIEEFCKIIDYINSTIDTFNKYENEFLEAFSYAMEARDTYTKGHSHRVARYAKIIAKNLGFNEAKQEELYKAGLLHDIGKIGVPDNILLKPGKLTPNEYKIVKYHSIFSYEIVQRISQFKSMANYVRHHHERCDGSGYPDGLKCDKIETEAKILAIADVFDALTSKRTYRDKLSPEETMDILKKEQLDQEIIEKVGSALVEGYISEDNVEIRLGLTKEIDEIRKELFNIDYMTGLRRRRNFVLSAEKLVKEGKPFVMFMVDIRSLSFINYEFSTQAGDKVIIYTAVALSEVLEELGYKDNNLSRAYNDAFLFTIPLKDEDELSKLNELTQKIKASLTKKVRSMIKENDKDRFVDEMNESLESFIDFHVLYCVYPYEARDVEKMIYVCVSKKTLSLSRLNNVDKE